MACTNCGGDKRTYVSDGDEITFSGAGTQASPYVPHLVAGANTLAFEVRDSSTINFTVYGSGLPGDPIVLTGDTSSASKLVNLGDVAVSPAPSQGRVPMWIGQATTGRFELRTPGTRYTTHAARGDGLYQGEVIRETDTGGRFEWDGSQYVDLVPSSVPPSSLDPSVLQNKGTLDGTVDWNTLTSASGIYRVSAGINSSNNTPQGASGNGTLLVYKSGLSVTQLYHAATNPTREFFRTKFSDSDWSSWQIGALFGDIQNLQNDRANGDNALQQQINAEASTRAQRDSALTSDYNAQIQNVYGAFDGGRLDGRYTRNLGSSGRMVSGEGVVTNFSRDSNTGQYFGYIDIKYDGFVDTPRVIANAVSADSGGVIAQVQNRSSTGSRIYLSRRNNADTGVMWLAVGQ